MKRLFLLLFVSASVQVGNAGTLVTFTGAPAQTAYHAMTKVFEDGAAGHIYKTGKNITCIRTNADMDINGKPVPQEDPRRYKCKMKVDASGNLMAGQ